MTEMPIAEAKARFSDVLRRVLAGDDVIVTRGIKREPIAAIISIEAYRASTARTLGALTHWGPIVFHDEWHMTDEELLTS